MNLPCHSDEMKADPDGHFWHSPQFVDDWIRAREGAAGTASRARLAEAQRILFAAAKQRFSEPLRLLDMGSGWGRFLEAFLKEFDRSTVVALDFSMPMLDAARERLGSRSEQVEYRHQDLTEVNSISGLDGHFELIFSSQTLHHFEPAVLGHLYRQVFERLVPGGLFMNCDRVCRPPALVARLAYRAALTFPPPRLSAEKTRSVDRLALGIDRMLTRVVGHGHRRDHDVTLAEHLDLMQAAGLNPAWRPLSAQRFILCGIRPE